MGAKQKAKLYLLIASLNVVMMLLFVLLAGSPTPVNAAAGINSQLSFEGKIVNSNGTNLSNGTYNMQFKIYQDGNNMGSGSTLKWTENRLVGGSGGVTLVDGTFHVNLGSVTAFGSSVDWNQDTLWLSMQIGNTSSCTITTSFQVDCSGDGEMTPYIRLTAVPYANNAAALSGLVASNFVQLAQGVQTDSSTTNSSIGINKTGGTANILQLQKSSADVFVINNSGRITLQPAADLTAGQTHVAQTFTNGSSSAGTVNGYSQTISIANTGFASTTNGMSIAITDNAAPSNTNNGIKIALDGINTAQTNTGLNISITGSNLISYGVNSVNSTDGGLGVRGLNDATGAAAKVYYGVSGGSVQTAAAAYTSYGVAGSASAGTGATAYGGYFSVTGNATAGAALYATNNTSTNNIFKLQDNTTDVLTVANGGFITVQPAASMVAGQTHISQTLTNGSSTGGIVQGYSQTITVSNASSASTTKGINIAITDATSLANTNIGLSIDMSGVTNSAATRTAAMFHGGSVLQTPSSSYFMGGADTENSGTSTDSFYDGVISGKYGYGVKSGDTGTCSSSNRTGCELQIYDMSAPTSPVYLGGADTSGTNIPWGVAVSGRYAFVARGGDNGTCSSSIKTGCELQIYDVSNPTNPTYVGGSDATEGGGSTSSFFTVATSGRYVFVGKAGSTASCGVGDRDGCELQIYDVSNPTAPLFINGASVDNPTDPSSNGVDWLNDIAISGRYIAVARSGEQGTCSNVTKDGCELQIYDVSIPSSPSYVGGADSINAGNGTIGFDSIASSNNNVYIGSSGSTSTCSSATRDGCEIKMFNISNPGTPSYVGGADVLNSGSGSNTIYSIAVSGRYIYTGAGSNASSCSSTTRDGCEIKIFDASIPANMSFVGGSDSGSSSRNYNALNVSGRYIYAFGSGDSGTCSGASNVGCELQILDISGMEATSITANSLLGGSLNVQNNAQFGDEVDIGGSLTVGQRIQANGSLSVNGSTLIRHVADPSLSDIFNLQLADGSNILQVTNPVADQAGVTLRSIGANRALTLTSAAATTWSTTAGNLTLNSGGGTLVLGTNTNTLQRTATAFSIDLATAASSTLTVTNSNASNVASLSVEGDVTIGSGMAYKVGATSGSSISACAGGEYVASFTSSGGIVTGGTCTTLPAGGATSLDDAYNQSAGTGNTITLTAAGDGVLIQDASTTVGGNLFAVQENSANGGSNLFAVTTTGFLVEALSGNDALTLDTSTSTPELRVHGSTDTEYARIWFDSATDTAYFGASTGTAVLGSGTGAVNVTAGAGAGFVITGNAASTISTTAGDLTIDSGGAELILGASTTTIQKATTALAIDLTNAAKSTLTITNSGAGVADLHLEGNLDVGGNILSGNNSTIGSITGTLTLQGASSTTLLSTTASSVTVDSGTTGNVIIGATNATNAKNVAIGNNNSGSTVDIDGGTGATGIEIGNTTTAHGIQIGTDATGDNDIAMGGVNAGSTLTLEAGTGASAIQIGNGATAHGIQIGTGAAIQTIVIGSTNSTSKLTLQGGVLTTTNNNSGIIIGGGYSSSDTSLVALTLDSFATFTDTVSSCSASVNGGSIYYNSVTNAVRACVNGSWEDLTTTGGLGIMAYGVVQDSGSNPGDLASLQTTGVTGPCKVSWLSATQVRVSPCSSYSGGRKVIVAQTDLTLTTTTTNRWANVCLRSTDGIPDWVGPGNAQTASAIHPTFSITSPVVCLATIQQGTASNGSFATGGNIFDTRPFLDATKTLTTTAAAMSNGYLAQVSTTGVTTSTGTLGTAGQRGVIVLTNGAAAASNAPNAILTLSGPAYVKAIAGTAGQNVHSSATAAFATSSTTTTYGIYGYLGVTRTTWAGTCTSAATCLGSLYVDVSPR